MHRYITEVSEPIYRHKVLKFRKKHIVIILYYTVIHECDFFWGGGVLITYLREYEQNSYISNRGGEDGITETREAY
jgi:hypothetical protein